ncbi:MAG: site-specific integrase [Candidatus Binatia bacterium]|nr:site-specific integrase [Candidatus Binatia bacterium]
MATYQKRKNKDGTITHRAIIRRRGATPQSQSFASKAAAQAWAGRIESATLNGERGGEVAPVTFGDLLDRYAADVSPTKKGCRWERLRIGLAKRDPIADLKLKDLDGRAVTGWRDRRLKAVGTGTVNREWTLLSAACSIAICEWHWLRTNPFGKAAGVKRPQQPEHRDRLATDDELAKLEAAAEAPTQKVVMLAARWALETAMRSGEILGLTPDRVDTTSRVARLVDTWADREENGGEFTSLKTGVRRDVPLSAEAIRIWEETGGLGFELTADCRDVNWRKLCAKAGVKNLHFHDLRHTAITRLAKKLQVLELARMTGHADLNELMTYYNESAANIALKL